MTDHICRWLEGCEQPATKRRLCGRHYERARVAGSLGDYHEQRFCDACQEPLPLKSQTNRRFCSPHCCNVAAWALADRQERRKRHKEWRDQTAERRQAEILASRPTRYCAECGLELPATATKRRKYCSVACGNKVAVREGLAERVVANQAWRKANPAKVAAWREANREKSRAFSRAYFAANPYVYRDLAQQRRIRLAKVGGPGVSRRDWERVRQAYGERCAYCHSKRPLTMDHVVPISRGGWHAIGNILPACRSCNASKSNRLLVEWRIYLKKIGRL